MSDHLGDEGLSASADQLAKWRAALPDAQVTEIPGAGHWPHEEKPDESRVIVLDWTLSTR